MKWTGFRYMIKTSGEKSLTESVTDEGVSVILGISIKAFFAFSLVSNLFAATRLSMGSFRVSLFSKPRIYFAAAQLNVSWVSCSFVDVSFAILTAWQNLTGSCGVAYPVLGLSLKWNFTPTGLECSVF